MGNSSVTIGGLFLEGILSFFSPCVLPLIPLYIGYLTAGRNENEPKHQLKTFLLTLCFVLGISTVFFAAGLGSTALQTFFQNHTIQLQLLGGFLLLVLGCSALGLIRIPLLEREYRFNFFKQGQSSPLQAFLLGFFFSFAWSPCIGPLLASAMVAAASASTKAMGFIYIGAYTLGFIIPFLLVGAFTDAILAWLKEHRSIVRYTGIIGGAVVAGMGVYMLFQANRNIMALQRAGANGNVAASSSAGVESGTAAIAEGESETGSDDAVADAERYNFTLKDIDGNEHSLTDYVGKPLLLNFFGTWCHYCNQELPDLQKVADEGDVQVILIAAPGLNGEGTAEQVEQTMKDNGYSFLILYDEQYTVTRTYGISGYPTTFAMKDDGSFLGYMPGYMSADILKEVVSQLTE